jgi:pimeloyl-ACP methyl ester carboxylesterase
VEWRGTGASRVPPPGASRWNFSVDDHIDKDAPAVVEEALRAAAAPQAFWLGHSLGGLIGYAAAQGPLVGGQLRGLLALGSPAFFNYDRLLQHGIRVGLQFAYPHAFRQRLLSISMAPWLGYVTLPMSDVMVNPKHIPPPIQRKVYANVMSSVSRKVMLQFQDWIAHDAFRSFDGKRDYRAGLPRVQVPALVMGGSKDKLSPPVCIRSQYELLGSEDKTLMIFGPENGDGLDYGHGDLLFGSGAPKEVYPRIAAWMESRATRV